MLILTSGMASKPHISFHWLTKGFGRSTITAIGSQTPLHGEENNGGKINSVQNGLLLRRDIHQLFAVYMFSRLATQFDLIE